MAYAKQELEIVIYDEIPKNYKGTYGYNKFLWQRHYADGFRLLITPIYNPVNQELGAIFFDENNDVFTYPVIALTPQEQQELAVANALKSIDEAYEQHELNGKEYSKNFQRSLAAEFLVFQRLTEVEAKQVGAFLKDVFFIINEGQWKNALDAINLLSANVVEQPYLEKIRTEVETYINNNYTQ